MSSLTSSIVVNLNFTIGLGTIAWRLQKVLISFLLFDFTSRRQKFMNHIHKCVVYAFLLQYTN